MEREFDSVSVGNKKRKPNFYEKGMGTCCADFIDENKMMILETI
jgi:hypothetical protein